MPPQCDSAIGLHLLQNKQCANNYNTMINNFLSLPGQEECISPFSIESHLHQNLKTYSMSPEGIRLFFTNFPLVSVSQHNANSISINTALPPFYRFLVSPLTVTSRSTNQLTRRSYKNHDHHSRILFSRWFLKSARRKRSNLQQPLSRLLKLRDESDSQSLTKHLWYLWLEIYHYIFALFYFCLQNYFRLELECAISEKNSYWKSFIV